MGDLNMDKLSLYRQHICNLLLKRAEQGSSNANLELQAILDQERDHYQLVCTGWKDPNTHVYGCIVHLDIKNGKIWVQYDGTEEGVAEQLAALGVPRQEIVLAYHPPHVRPYTDFAVG